MENKENIDQLFRNGLLEPDIPFDENDWEKMSRKLDASATKRPAVVWWIWGSVAAAILVASLFLIFFNAGVNEHQSLKNQIAKQRQSREKQAPVEEKQGELAAQNSGTTSAGARNKKKPEQRQVYAAIPSTSDTAASQVLKLANTGQIVLNAPAAGDNRFAVPFNASIVTAVPKPMRPSESYVAVVKNVKKKMKTAAGRNSGLTLSAMLAPDISYARSSIPSKVSSNAGLLATYGVSPRLSLTSGAIYSNKYYNSNVTGVNAYNASGANYQVNASCNVLDIPLNVNYKLLSKRAYSVSVSTGLSSYLMLKEKYDYIYPQAGANPNIVSYQVNNQNKHILGVANIGISVERKITNNLSIGVQPFMKLPLTGIGAGDASLKSSGLSFSLNMNLFPAKKPGKFAGLRHY